MNVSEIKGPSDLYAMMVEVAEGKHDRPEFSGSIRVTKKLAKKWGVTWSFIEKSAEVLGLEVKVTGMGHYIRKPEQK
jgi:hypothetical protein